MDKIKILCVGGGYHGKWVYIPTGQDHFVLKDLPVMEYFNKNRDYRREEVKLITYEYSVMYVYDILGVKRNFALYIDVDWEEGLEMYEDLILKPENW